MSRLREAKRCANATPPPAVLCLLCSSHTLPHGECQRHPLPHGASPSAYPRCCCKKDGAGQQNDMLHRLKRGQCLWPTEPPIPQKGCTASLLPAERRSRPPSPLGLLLLAPVHRHLPAAALPPGCSSVSLYLEGLALPRAGLTRLGSFYRFLKRLPLNDLYGYLASENHSHQTRRMQTPASHHAPAVTPVHAAGFLKNRPLVPLLNYWKSKYRLEV